MYSSYKHHTTMKCLIAVNPHGGACFISDMYEGSISDVAIFEDCGFLDHVNPGDSFLLDKGFTVQEQLLSKQATIFIPPFLGQRDKFTKEEVIQTKRIAKARIHVERFNERLKRFRLLDQIIPLILRPMASQLVYVGELSRLPLQMMSTFFEKDEHFSNRFPRNDRHFTQDIFLHLE